jgi:hypothetical protein
VLGGDLARLDALHETGPEHALPSRFAVTDLASAAVGVALLAAREYSESTDDVVVDRAHAAAVFRSELYLKPIGWELPPVWDALAGDYPTADGWVRLHTNYAHHRDACLRALDAPPDRDAIAAIVAARTADDVEAAVVAAGGCAAALRSESAWAAHPQGDAVAQEPFLHHEQQQLEARDVGDDRERIRVVDLTRVIAGPLATCVLAAHGFEVIRVEPPGFEEVATVNVAVNAAKQRRETDLRRPTGRDELLAIVRESDVVVHGYRPGALHTLELGEASLRRVNPALVLAGLDAYGWTGPWATRRGFDSLVQMSSGIAWCGDAHAQPRPLPCQALDHATGWILAAAVFRALSERRARGVTTAWRASLARTARLLINAGTTGDPDAPPIDPAPYLETAATPWGRVERVRLPG